MTNPVPCARCGSDDIVRSRNLRAVVQFSVQCRRCNTSTPAFTSEQQALSAWNEFQPVPDANGWHRVSEVLPAPDIWLEFWHPHLSNNALCSTFDGRTVATQYEAFPIHEFSHWRLIKPPTDS